MAALGAEGVAEVPVHELSGFGVDGRCRLWLVLLWHDGLQRSSIHIPSAATSSMALPGEKARPLFSKSASSFSHASATLP